MSDFAALALPLTNLLKNRTEWRWGQEQNDAFETLKRALLDAPILSHDDGSCKLEGRRQWTRIGRCIE